MKTAAAFLNVEFVVSGTKDHSSPEERVKGDPNQGARVLKPLTYLEPGQRVGIEVDAFPARTWTGEVESVSQATGAVMSVLPTQDASGNWVKVVQRVPVRIGIDEQADGPQLRAGMSVTVSIDTGRRRTVADLVGALRRLAGL